MLGVSHILVKSLVFTYCVVIFETTMSSINAKGQLKRSVVARSVWKGKKGSIGVPLEILRVVKLFCIVL